MKRNLHLLIIDPQNDFCDLPPSHLPHDPVRNAPHAPALPVKGAHADMQRLAHAIHAGLHGISAISVTLDSHHRFDIAHPNFWFAEGGASVAPFTQITAADVRAGRFQPRDPSGLPRALAYLDALDANGRYQLMVWPVHCEIGSWGHNVHDDVRAAYNAWEDATLGVVGKIAKGSNPWTEHYSAVMAEVPDEADPKTQLNRELIASLAGADRVYITGEAGSHCVKATTEHLADHIEPSRLVLVSDCMSPVEGFDAQYQAFLQAMAARGLQTISAAQMLEELKANAGAAQ